MKEDKQTEKNFTDEEKQLLNKYIEEYNDLYQKILILSELDFMDNIKKKILLTIKSKIKNFSQKSMKKIEDYIKQKIYFPDYRLATIIKNNILNRTKREIALHYFRGEIIPHCEEDKKGDYYIHVCGERFQFFRYKLNNNLNKDLNNNPGILYDYILYCMKCNLIYKSSLIKFKCFKTNIEFYSKILIDSNDDKSKSYKNIHKCYATWKKYHCNAIINDTMKCHKCEGTYIFLQEGNLLYCPTCKIKKNPLDITWKCLICQKEFQSEAKIYNPLEYKSLKICVKDAIINKIKAEPEYMVCKCNLDIKNTRFFHKAACRGELYIGEVNSQKVVVCGKCDTLGLYEGYIWTCPKCLKRFKTKKREGSVSTKLGLNESPPKKKEIFNKKNRNLSEKNLDNNSKFKNNELQNLLKEKNRTISNENSLNYLNNNKDHLNETNNIKKKSKINIELKEKLTNSFTEETLFNNKTKNLNNPKKFIPDKKLKLKQNLTNTSFYTKIDNLELTNSSKKDIITLNRDESSNESKFKSERYIMNNCNKKNKYHIKKNIQIKTENIGKEKDIDSISNSKEKNVAFSLTKNNSRFKKIQSESKDKNNKYKNNFFMFPTEENTANNQRKLSSYRKSYYSINSSLVKGMPNKNYLNYNRRNSFRIKGKKNYEGIDKYMINKENKNLGELKRLKTLNYKKENRKEGKIFSSIDDSKKKYKKKNKSKNYQNEPKESKSKSKSKNKKGENKIISEVLNSAEMNVKGINTKKINYYNSMNENKIKDNNNSNINSRLKLTKNNKMNINININNSAINITENDNNNDINNDKRIFSNSIIINNIAITDKNSKLKSLKNNKNDDYKKYKNLNENNNMNNIKSINIKNINNINYYNPIHDNNKNLNSCYRKIINNKNSESTTLESEQNIKNKNSNSKNKTTVNIINGNNTNNYYSNVKYLLNQKYANFSDYKLIKQIGKGSFGQIFMVENDKNESFALKKLLATNLKDLKTLEHEYQILLDLQSCGKKMNLVQIYGIETKQLDPTTFVMYVLMELASTDWEKEILSRHNINNYYNEKELMEIISSLITTFSQLQKERISHRDIKPQNILIFKESNTYKLADFGEAKELLKDDKPIERQTLRGTELYMSPILFYALRSSQMIKYVKHNPYKSDLFSFGLCCLFAASLCFESVYDVRELKNNTAIKYIIQKYLGNRYSNVVINIISSMLDLNEDSRNDFIEMEKEIKKLGY